MNREPYKSHWSHGFNKNQENRGQSQTCLSYAEVHPVLRKAKTGIPLGLPQGEKKGGEEGGSRKVQQFKG